MHSAGFVASCEIQRRQRGELRGNKANSERGCAIDVSV